MLHRTIVMPAGRHTASLIFLHGSGDTGVGIQSWIADCFDGTGDKQGFNFNHIKVIYPTAPPQPYTPMNGRISNVWYDRHKISYDTPEIAKSVDEMSDKLTELIQAEVNAGIPPSRILVGGFSMGGSMALHLGFRNHLDLGGVFALSSFLSAESTVYDSILEHQKTENSMPELFMAHGNKDPLVLFEWGKKTFQKLTSLGVKGQFHKFKYFHEIGFKELLMLRNWIVERIPDDTNS
uniref:lysophospholipase-like protein 1 isoform X1 n=1 Tax=Styela clava TaxID=7725 RepID=UPI00193A14E6|nr:lysophospholipase-like protein 1 isoform X1 [Styela clava]